MSNGREKTKRLHFSKMRWERVIMKKRKWVLPTIIVIIATLMLTFATVKIYNLMFGGGLGITTTDLMDALNACKIPLIIVGVVIVAGIVVIVSASKMEKIKRKLVRIQAPIAMILSVLIAANWIMLDIEYSIFNSIFSEETKVSEETLETGRKIADQIASEGIVLLKNDDNGLPIKKGTKLNLFGWSSVRPLYGGTGSGATSEEKSTTLIQGLENAGYEVNTELIDFYEKFRSERPVGTIRLRELGSKKGDWTIPEPTIEEYEEAEIFKKAVEFSDTALIVISRTGGEGFDVPQSLTKTDEHNVQYGELAQYYTFGTQEDDLDAKKSYLELSNRESKMVERVCKEFDNVVVVVNSSNAMELGWLEDYESIKAAVLCAAPGEVGFDSLGRVLNGEVNPSGHLADTYVYDLLNTPTVNNFGGTSYDNYAEVTGSEENVAKFLNYSEGIYVGYKFYETAAEEGLINYEEVVQYPFGYGMSYTTFESKIADVKDTGDDITLSIDVTNTGDTAGKYVAEIFYNPPYTNGGIEKASANLIEFAKTELLEPGASQTLEITFAYEDMSSYDSECIKSENGAYVLEAGEYEINLCSDSHTIIDTYVTVVEEDIIYDEEHEGARSSDKEVAQNHLGFAEGDVEYLSRADGFANYEKTIAAPTEFSMNEEALENYTSFTTFNAADYDDEDIEMPITGADNGVMLSDLTGVDYDDPKWDALLDQLTVDEMAQLSADGGYHTIAIEKIGLSATEDCDGPTGVHSNYNAAAGVGYPGQVMLACTWNKELAKEKGIQIAKECAEINCAGWYGPAMNIHRSAFGGRNFEYYSEDGYLSGVISAGEVAGATENGLICYVKHFAFNEQDNYRQNGICTWTNEQAAREIYLKAFEYPVKAGAMGVMTSMNAIGTIWSGGSEALLTDILRNEWGFNGSVITDAMAGGWYMNQNLAIRTGGTKMLAFSITEDFYIDRDSAGTVNALRNAAHGTLYALANSNVMMRTVETPNWVIALYVVDVVVILALVAWEIIAFNRYRKNKKKQQEG